MSGTIYSGHYRIGSNGTYSGITLASSPATLAGYIYVTSGAAILGGAGTAWTFSNQGLMVDYGMGGRAGDYGSLNNPGGIDLQSGGLVVNGNTGTDGQGQITGGGPFYADGRIEETTVGVAITGGAGTVVNYGSIKSAGIGVYLGAGGSVDNGSGADTIASIAAAVVVAGAPGTVANFATIGHGGELGGNGIVLEAGGFISNAASGYLRNGTTIAGAPGTIVNAGEMTHSVSLAAGGQVANEAGGRILYGLYFSGTSAAELLNAGALSGVALFGGTGTVANTGTMSGGLFGVTIAGAGNVINGESGSAGGLIAGSVMGVTIGGTGGLVINYGLIEALAAMPGAGVQLAGPGTIRNAGTLFETGGYKSAAAASLPQGGLLANSGEIIGTPLGAFGSGATISNSGLIGATPTGSALGAAVALEGGLFTNTGTAEVAGAMATGVDLVGGGTIVNQGLIRAAGTAGNSTAAGIYIDGGGTVLNAGTILAGVSATGSSLPTGIDVTGTVGVSLANFGTIASSIGILVARYQRTGTNGNYGRIDPKPNVTLLNAGLIVGTGTTVSGAPTYIGAVRFGDGNNLLIVQPGAAFTGVVLGGTGSNALELATGTATGYGVLGGLGTSLINFGTVRVDPGADWQVSGTLASGVTLSNDGTLLANAGGTLVDSTPLLATGGATGTVEVAGHGVAELLSTVAASQTARFIDLVGTLQIGSIGGFAGTIAGFAGGDTISLLGVTATKATYADHRLTITNSSAVVGTLAVAGTYTGDSFSVVRDSAGNSDITTNAPCFAAGTRIRTTSGEIPVEHLQPGMAVLAADGQPRRVAWLGHRRVACRRHPIPELVQPVRVAAGAFAPGVPHRTLVLSPDHAVFEAGLLIPIRHLVNGRSIRQIAVDAIEYWHVELDRHAVLLAEGLPAESYLDTGNRAAFGNGGAFLDLHPDFSPRSWREACAELVQDGPRLRAVKRRLFRRAGPPPADRGLVFEVQAGGRTLVPTALSPGRWRYRLPPGHAVLDLLSPAWVPAHCREEALDRRTLGVRILGLAFDGTSRAPAQFGTGFHPPEQTAQGPCRWTTGLARLSVPPGAASLDIAVGDGASALRSGRAIARAGISKL